MGGGGQQIMRCPVVGPVPAGPDGGWCNRDCGIPLWGRYRLLLRGGGGGVAQ